MAHSALFDLHFLLIPLFLLATIAPSIHQSIPLGTTITAADENSPWASLSGEFAFGFRHLPNNYSLFLLAIWYQKIPERTVVWSANRDNPVQRGSRVELVNNGHLVLYDHKGREIRKKPKAMNARATSASMLDTGNLVLLSMDSSTIWESFNEPTDTILPNQTLTKPSKLSSRRYEMDYSKGQFELRLQEDGDLVLYTVPLEGIRGTRGYISPEWFKDKPITAKVDVYSFGVLLLEIICCRRNLEMGLENEERVILTDWAYDCYVEMRLDWLVENDEDAKEDLKRVERMVMVAIWCIQENPTMRPSMMNVTEMLEGVVEVSKPLSPYSTSSVFS
ncbi:hypothetical protein AAC387_Pa02g1143 [Persea americana]